MKNISIQHDPEAQKFFLALEENEGYLLYKEEGDILDLYSTYVPDAFRGEGIAGKLVEAALDHARSNGYQVRPTCPYVATYIERNQEHQDLRA